MSLPHFSYASPDSLEEALTLLARHQGAARVMAGGTDLLLKMERGQIRPELLIGLKRIGELRGIDFDPERGLTIGALAKLSQVVEHPVIREKYPALAYAASQTATVQIRNMGTIAGNLCNASPCADNAPTLMARGARIELASLRGRRWLDLDRFFLDRGVTAVEPDEMVTAIQVPVPRAGCAAAFQNISARSKVDMSAVSVGVMVTRANGTCREARIVLGAVAPVPLRAREAEELARGRELRAGTVEEIAAAAAGESKPISDVRASASWRRRMVAVLTRRALLEAWQRAGAPGGLAR